VTTFNDLIDFYGTEFKKTTIFNKTDFFSTAVFSSAVFHKNALFIYSTFKKLGIFNQATFKKGLDLSQSIINGNLAFFETNLKNFLVKKIESNSPEYDKSITEDGNIPIQNKRETFRIIKQQLEQQSNLIEAEKYAKFEKQIYMGEILKGCKLSKIPSLITLFFNLISNYYKSSWFVALFFILVFGYLFDLWLENISTYYFYSENTLLKLINPTDLSFYNKFEDNTYAYSVYFGGKIVLGYGIYQLIQAFRKFK
jgi:hypothetical protein